jgi:hypothetical protein
MIIGTARMKMATPSEPVVKSRFVPHTASRSIDQKELSIAVSADGALTSKDINTDP